MYLLACCILWLCLCILWQITGYKRLARSTSAAILRIRCLDFCGLKSRTHHHSTLIPMITLQASYSRLFSISTDKTRPPFTHPLSGSFHTSREEGCETSWWNIKGSAADARCSQPGHFPWSARRQLTCGIVYVPNSIVKWLVATLTTLVLTITKASSICFCSWRIFFGVS